VAQGAYDAKRGIDQPTNSHACAQDAPIAQFFRRCNLREHLIEQPQDSFGIRNMLKRATRLVEYSAVQIRQRYRLPRAAATDFNPDHISLRRKQLTGRSLPFHCNPSLEMT